MKALAGVRSFVPSTEVPATDVEIIEAMEWTADDEGHAADHEQPVVDTAAAPQR
jgi:hypothetical protein